MRSFILFSLFSLCSASNILLMFPLSMKSHVNSFLPVFKKLSENGHKLTMVTSFKHNFLIPNCTYITVRDVFMEQMQKVSTKEIKKDFFKDINVVTFLPMVWKVHSLALETFLKEDYLKDLLQGNFTFDLMISETLYLQEIFVAFGHIYSVPVVNIDAHAPSVWSCYLTGNANPYAYIPNFRLPFTDRMSFMERIQNTLMNLQEFLGSYYYYLPKQEELMRKYLSNEKHSFPPLLDMLKNTSITLVDSHFSLGYVRPYLPNTVEVGGLTFNTVGQLDEEYQKYLDESTNGVILFTFGSILNISFFPKEMVNIFTATFALLKQNVIMKWENEELPNKPKNVKIAAWLPQNKILAHPNCRLFITHGGIHGLSEAVYHETPLVVIPFASDQHYNAKFAEKNGFATILGHNNLTKENFLYAINTAIENPKFREKIKRRSLIVKDKALSAVDTAVYWVEYVLRHRGAKHLRPASLDLNIFQYLLLDVIFAIFLGFLVCCYTVYVFVRTLIYCFKKLSIDWKEKYE